MASSPVQCPRCGYDQRGFVSTWTDSCPLQGTCSECGLIFKWAEVLDPKRFEPKWCVEYSLGRIRFLRACMYTLACSFWPWFFWSRVQMSLDMKGRRIGRYLLFFMAMAYLGVVFSMAGLAWASWHRDVNWAIPGFVAPSTTTAYGAAMHAFLMPWSSTSPGQYTRNRIPHTAPVWHFKQHWSNAIRVTIAFLWIHSLAAIGFALLPQSRRKAKVKAMHIVRVWLYGIAIVLLLLPLHAAATIDYAIRGYTLVTNLAGLIFIPIFLMLIIWWSVATSKYLRMQHAWGVGLAVITMASLATGLSYTVQYLIAAA